MALHLILIFDYYHLKKQKNIQDSAVLSLILSTIFYIVWIASVLEDKETKYERGSGFFIMFLVISITQIVIGIGFETCKVLKKFARVGVPFMMLFNYNSVLNLIMVLCRFMLAWKFVYRLEEDSLPFMVTIFPFEMVLVILGAISLSKGVDCFGCKPNSKRNFLLIFFSKKNFFKIL